MVVTPEDITMTRAAFAETPPGSKIVPLDDTGPYAMQGVGVYEREGEIATCKDSAKKVASDFTRCILDDEPDVLLVYTSTEKKGVVLDNRPPGWSRQVVDELVASGEYRIRYQNGFNAVLVKTDADGGQRAAAGGTALATEPVVAAVRRGRMTADGWVWASLGLLLALLGARAWVVETGHATLGRTPVKVKVLTGACGLAVALVVGLVTANGGARLVYLVLHPARGAGARGRRERGGPTTAPDVPTTTPVPPEPATVAPPPRSDHPGPGDDPGPATVRRPCGPRPPGPATRPAARAPVTRAPATAAPRAGAGRVRTRVGAGRAVGAGRGSGT